MYAAFCPHNDHMYGWEGKQVLHLWYHAIRHRRSWVRSGYSERDWRVCRPWSTWDGNEKNMFPEFHLVLSKAILNPHGDQRYPHACMLRLILACTWTTILIFQTLTWKAEGYENGMVPMASLRDLFFLPEVMLVNVTLDEKTFAQKYWKRIISNSYNDSKWNTIRVISPIPAAASRWCEPWGWGTGSGVRPRSRISSTQQRTEWKGF